MKPPTLLEKAKAINPKRSTKTQINQEVIELAIAWAKDEITLTQVGMALKGRMITGSAYVTLAIGLRQAVRRRILKL